MTEQEWKEVKTYDGFEPPYTGVWLNPSKARYELWRSGPWGATMFGWVPMDSPVEHRNYWLQAVSNA